MPATSRDDIQFLAPHDICAAGVRLNTLRAVTTSGSTGAPLTVWRTRAEEQLLLALRARAFEEFGFGLRCRRAVIDHLDPATLRGGGRRELHERLGLLPRVLIDWRLPKAEIVDTLERFRPQVISGPPGILSSLADDLTAEDRRRLNVPLVTTGAEMMTAPTRRRIEQGFGAPVADRFGSHEVVFIAMQPPGNDEYRVCGESVFVEVVQEDGRPAQPGASGELIVTALHSFAMPFIRYRLGDRVVLGRASDPYQSLRSIEGRIVDRFRLPSGQLVHGYTLGEVVEASGLEVRRFQITQEQRGAFRVRLLLRSGERSFDQLEAALRERLEPGVGVSIEVVDALDHDGARKFYPFVSVERLEAWRAAQSQG
ncbi:MAG: AMP-binding protein [Acidobacteria bacterium]|nr:AMP-binding protein [Acidobacteriota bacterium]